MLLPPLPIPQSRLPHSGWQCPAPTRQASLQATSSNTGSHRCFSIISIRCVVCHIHHVAGCEARLAVPEMLMQVYTLCCTRHNRFAFSCCCLVAPSGRDTCRRGANKSSGRNKLQCLAANTVSHALMHQGQPAVPKTLACLGTAIARFNADAASHTLCRIFMQRCSTSRKGGRLWYRHHSRERPSGPEKAAPCENCRGMPTQTRR